MRALVIDDERLARKELINLLNQLETVEVVGEAVNVDDAKEKIDQLQPDVIFLDIQMPEKKQALICWRSWTICPMLSSQLLTTSMP